MPLDLERQLVIRSVTELMTDDDIKYLIQHNTPMQQIKDMLMLRALKEGVGICADLKIFWLPGRQFTITKAVVLSLELTKNEGAFIPTTRQIPTQYFGKPAFGQPWFGFMMRSDTEDGMFFRTLSKQVDEFWFRYARKIETGAADPKNWDQSQPEWMTNSAKMFALARSSKKKMVQYLPPQTVGAIPFWAKHQQSYTQFGIHTPAVGEIIANDTVCALTVWGRQWSEHLVRSVRETYWQHVRDAFTTEFSIAHLRGNVLILSHILEPQLPPPISTYHEIVSQSLLLAGSVQAQRLLQKRASFDVAAALVLSVIQRNMLAESVAPLKVHLL